MKSVVPQEDLVMTVAAARTAWILTDVNWKRGKVILLRRSASTVSEWTFLPRPSLNTGQ
jgi:hypothetical protein